MSFFYNLKYRFGTFSIAEKIILINVVFFLFPMLLNVLFFLFNIPTSSYLNWLQLSPNLWTFIKRPWSLITYSFVHSGFFHLLWNMVLLFYAGRLLLNLFPDRIFINNYFLGVISGGLIFISSYSIFPVFEGNYPPLIGASAGVMAVFIFICTYTPNQEIRFFFIKLKLKHIGLAFFFLDIIQIPYGNAGGHLAHVGGAVLGFFYARQLGEGRDIGSGFQNIWQSIFKKKYLKTVYRSPKNKSATSKNSGERINQNKIDSILDKISNSGYDSLSKEEKDVMAGSLNRSLTWANDSNVERPISRTERQNLNLNLDAKVDITLGGRARYIVGQRDFTLASFNVFNSRNTFRLGTINKTVARQLDGNNRLENPNSTFSDSKNLLPSTEYSRYIENIGRYYQFPTSINENTGLRHQMMFTIDTQYWSNHKPETHHQSYARINEISTLYSFKPLPNNSVVDQVMRHNKRIRRTIARSLADRSLSKFFIPETEQNNLYSAFREIHNLESKNQNSVNGMTARYQYRILIRSLQTILRSYINRQPHLKGALENQIGDTSKHNWQARHFAAENVMDWANNIILGYANLISNPNFEGIPKHLKAQIKERIGTETSEYPQVSFDQKAFIQTLLTYADILISDYSKTIATEKDKFDLNDFESLLTATSIENLTKSLHSYNSHLAEIIGYTISNSEVDSESFAVLKGLEEKELDAARLFGLIEHSSRTGRRINQVNSYKEALLHLLRRSESIDLSTDNYAKNPHLEVNIELDHSSKLKGHTSAHIAIQSERAPSSEGLIIPLTIDTNLVYGRNNDFYIEGFDHRPPAFIDFEDYKSRSILEFKLGKTADNLVNERLTVRLEHPHAQMLHANTRGEYTFIVNDGSIEKEELWKTAIALRQEKNGSVRISSAQSGYAGESYYINEDSELDVINQYYLGIGASVPHGKLSAPVFRFSQFNSESRTGLGAHYYTSDPKEVKALVADKNYVMAEEELFFVSNKPAKGLRPVYKFEDPANGTFIWSRSDEESLDIEMGSEITTYTNKGIAWFTEEHNSTFDPLESSELRSNIRSNGVLHIRPSRNVNNTTDDNNLSQRNTPLTSYIDLSKKDSDTIRLNTRSFADTGILDIDGFGQDKQLVLFNRSDNYIPISYKPNSIVINNNYVIRFFDEGPKTPDASISISEQALTTTQKGKPINYLSPDAVKVFNVSIQNEVKSFIHKKDQTTRYVTDPKDAMKLFNDPSFEYGGIAFSVNPKSPDTTVGIYSYTNRMTGQVNYSTQREAWGIYDSPDYSKSGSPVFELHQERLEGLSPVHQIRENSKDLPELLLENDVNHEISQFSDEWTNEGVIGFAKPVDGTFEPWRRPKKNEIDKGKLNDQQPDDADIDDTLVARATRQTNHSILSNDVPILSTDDELISHSKLDEGKQLPDLLESASVDQCDCDEVELSTPVIDDSIISGAADDEASSMLEESLSLDQQLLLLTQLIDQHDAENPMDPETSQSFFVNPDDENFLT